MSPGLRPLLLSLLLASTTAAANTFQCGEDAFSATEVVERRAPQRGRPITAGPDTLCADLSETRRPVTPNIDVVVTPPGTQGNGGESGDAPIDRPRRSGRGLPR